MLNRRFLPQFIVYHQIGNIPVPLHIIYVVYVSGVRPVAISLRRTQARDDVRRGCRRRRRRRHPFAVVPTIAVARALLIKKRKLCRERAIVRTHKAAKPANRRARRAFAILACTSAREPENFPNELSPVRGANARRTNTERRLRRRRLHHQRAV